jgi:hypothetical protein
MKIVNHLGMLKAMARSGHINLHPDTGYKVKHWTGTWVKTYYVETGQRRFEYKGRIYGVRYFDGCYAPFVVLYETEEEISKPVRGFV